MDDECAKELMSKGPKHWSKAFFGVKSKCDIVDNNLSEAFLTRALWRLDRKVSLPC